MIRSAVFDHLSDGTTTRRNCSYWLVAKRPSKIWSVFQTDLLRQLFVLPHWTCFQVGCLASQRNMSVSKTDLLGRPPRWPSGLSVRLESGRSRVRIPLAPGFFRVESYQWLKHWYSSGYPARRLALQGQCWDWSARCQYTMTGWDGKFDLQLLSQCGST